MSPTTIVVVVILIVLVLVVIGIAGGTGIFFLVTNPPKEAPKCEDDKTYLYLDKDGKDACCPVVPTEWSRMSRKYTKCQPPPEPVQGSCPSGKYQYNLNKCCNVKPTNYDTEKKYYTVCSDISKPEVFSYGEYIYNRQEAEEQCKKLGAVLATSSQVEEAYNNGAEWCSTGHVADGDSSIYPMQTFRDGCGGPGVMKYLNNTTDKTSATCYGIKPAKGTERVNPFNLQKWSKYD